VTYGAAGELCGSTRIKSAGQARHCKNSFGKSHRQDFGSHFSNKSNTAKPFRARLLLVCLTNERAAWYHASC
jgi:hypothetical protein